MPGIVLRSQNKKAILWRKYNRNAGKNCESLLFSSPPLPILDALFVPEKNEVLEVAEKILKFVENKIALLEKEILRIKDDRNHIWLPIKKFIQYSLNKVNIELILPNVL